MVWILSNVAGCLFQGIQPCKMLSYIMKSRKLLKKTERQNLETHYQIQLKFNNKKHNVLSLNNTQQKVKIEVGSL